MSRKNESWNEWVFSSKLQDSINDFASKLLSGTDSNSPTTKDWLFLRNYCFANETAGLNYDGDKESSVEIEELLNEVLESIESGINLDESRLAGRSRESLNRIFIQIQPLTETGFLNFCKFLARWEDPQLLDISFDSVIIEKLKEKEEATLSTIKAISELAKEKPKHLCKIIMELLTSDSKNFTDQELLDHVFVVLPDNLKDALVMSIIKCENFKESQWPLLQVLITKTTVKSYHEIIMFMKNKCEEFSNNQAFARFLVHTCKNLQSNTYKDLLFLIAEKNQTLLKRQALKYLTSS